MNAAAGLDTQYRRKKPTYSGHKRLSQRLLTNKTPTRMQQTNPQHPASDATEPRSYAGTELEAVIEPQSLLECIEDVQSADADALPAESLRRVMDFFGVPPLEARVICIAVMEGLDNDSVNARSVTRALEMPLRTVAKIDIILKSLCRRGWLRTRDRDENSYSRDYRPHGRLMEAVTTEDAGHIQPIVVSGVNEHLQAMYQLIEVNEYLRTPGKELLADLVAGHQSQKSLPFVAWLDTHGLTPPELACVYYVVYKLLIGSDDVDIDDILKCVYPQCAERFGFRLSMMAGELAMTRERILRYDNTLSGRLVELNVGEALLPKLTELGIPIAAGNRAPKICECIGHTSVSRRDLFFEGMLGRQLQAFEKAISPESLPTLQERLRNKGMNPGLLAIFHGMPGTGKTESVLQMAARTGRDILKVDISKVRNKYVGESEKNIRAIFDDYRGALKKDGQAPILLFNEADGVLGRRISVSSSSDQMNNSMQNILLEELEVFTGILVATTNLAINLDEAFERRFTYKFRFGKAGTDALRAVWQAYFPELDAKLVDRLVAEHELSPAQIGNLAKKAEILRLVDAEEASGYEFFRDLIREESLHGHEGKNRIGFRA